MYGCLQTITVYLAVHAYTARVHGCMGFFREEKKGSLFPREVIMKFVRDTFNVTITSYIYHAKSIEKHNHGEKKKTLFVRGGIRTHAHICGPECSPIGSKEMP